MKLDGFGGRTAKITGLPPVMLTSDLIRPATPVHFFVILYSVALGGPIVKLRL